MKPKIYFAGKILKERDDTYRINVEPTEYFDLSTTLQVDKESYILLGAVVVGCDHGCYHGDTNHGAGVGKNEVCGDYNLCTNEKRQICLERCKKQIDEADIVVAEINEMCDCYGTFMEIGYAYAKQKKIIILSKTKHIEDRRQLWFAYQMSISSLPKHLDDVLVSMFYQIPVLKTTFGCYKNYYNFASSVLALSEDNMISGECYHDG